jgi:hypothetical protein
VEGTKGLNRKWNKLGRTRKNRIPRRLTGCGVLSYSKRSIRKRQTRRRTGMRNYSI